MAEGRGVASPSRAINAKRFPCGAPKVELDVPKSRPQKDMRAALSEGRLDYWKSRPDASGKFKPKSPSPAFGPTGFTHLSMLMKDELLRAHRPSLPLGAKRTGEVGASATAKL